MPESNQSLLSAIHQANPAMIMPSESASDYMIDNLPPSLVVKPHAVNEVSDLLKWSSAESQKVAPWGGGTQITLGNLPEQLDVVMDLGELNEIISFQPADLTVSVQAGITLDDLQNNLKAAEKFLPLEAPLSNRATIGGILSASSSGPLRHTYGLPREWLIGLKIISAHGLETKSGGQVVKNVTGYDLNKLYTGSLGTLGVIVEAIFKLAPRPSNHSVILASFASHVEAIESGQYLLQQIYGPQGLHVINSIAGSHLFNQETEDNRAYQLLAIFTGRTRAINRRLKESADLLKTLGAEFMLEASGSEAINIVGNLKNLGHTETNPSTLRVNINFPPSYSKEVTDWLMKDAFYHTNPNKPNDLVGQVIDIGFGYGSLIFWDHVEPKAEDIVRLRTFLTSLGGSAIIEQCPLYLKKEIDIWGDAISGTAIMRELKRNFDPSRTLNPGRFLSGI